MKTTEAARTPDRTREQLLLAAKHLFSRKGYDGTSVKELALLAGVNVSLVSYHFKGKEGLYRACLGEFGRARLAVAERILTPPASSDELRVRLMMFVDEMFVCHVEEPELTTIVHRECELELPVIPDIFKATFLKVFLTLEDFLRAAQRRKLVRADVDPHLAAAFLFGSILHQFKSDGIGKKYFGTTVQDPKHRAKASRQLVGLFLGGVRAKA